MQNISDLLAMTILVLMVFGIALALLWLRRRVRKRSAPSTLRKNRIIVDGSNVMYWGGEPEVRVIRRVLASLSKAGFDPIVYFDANVGYKLEGRYLGYREMAQRLQLPAKRVIVVPKGETADEHLLRHATKRNYRIVSNDRYRDWVVAFPILKTKGRLAVSYTHLTLPTTSRV